MRQSYKKINFQIKTINEIFDDHRNDLKSFPIQKIFSDSKFITFSVRLPGRTLFIYSGRGSNYEGIWYSSKNIPSEYRIRDRYLEYLRKYLVGARIKSFELDTDDRILFMNYFKRKSEGLFSLFYQGRSLYFINIFKDDNNDYRLFLSWELIRDNKIDVSTYEEMKSTALKYFETLGRKKIPLSRTDELMEDDSEKEISEYYSSSERKKTLAPSSKRKSKFYQRKESRIVEDLKKVGKWKMLYELIESIDYILPTDYEFKIYDIKFKIPQNWSCAKRLDEVYQKIKKLKKAERILTARLEETKKQRNHWVQGKLINKSSPQKILVPVWYDPKANGKKTDKACSTTKYNYLTFMTEEGVKFYVGKDVEANDYIRSKLAHKDDMWFHLDGMKSAHLIAKIKSFSDITPEQFTLFGSVLRDFTKTEHLELQLVYTNVKNIKGIKGKKGSVIIKKQKYLVTHYLNSWRKTISEV